MTSRKADGERIVSKWSASDVLGVTNEILSRAILIPQGSA